MRVHASESGETTSAANFGRRKVAVLGLGYVGLPLAMAAARAGHNVVGYDVSTSRIDDIQSGTTGLVDLDHDALAEQLASDSLVVTTDPLHLGPCEIYVICAPTPLRDGSPDLSMVMAGVDTVAGVLDPGDLVILESTTWPGTTSEVVAPRLRELTGLVAGVDVRLVFSPERVDPGNQEFPLTRIPKVIGGMTREDSECAADFYRTFLDSVHIVSGTSEAELAKILENTYRHVNLALVNELAKLYSDTGINLREAIDAAATKPFGFMPFYPGPGVGGHCIPIDPMYLIWRARRTGRTLQLVETAEQINRGMPAHVVGRAAALLNDVGKPMRGSKVLVLGVTYKPNVTDSRESSAFPVIEQLLGRHAEVWWHDPMVGQDQAGPAGTRVVDLTTQVVHDADLVVLHTPHAWYLNSPFVRTAPLLLDAHGALRALRLSNVFEI